MKKVFSVIIFFFLLFVHTASAQVMINEVQLSPASDRFIELYNNGDTDVDLTGWYIQRKTATGSTFGSLVSSTNFENKTIGANEYFVIARSDAVDAAIIVGSLTLTENNTIRMRDSSGNDVDEVAWGSIAEGESHQLLSGVWATGIPTPGVENSGSETFVQSTSSVSSGSGEGTTESSTALATSPSVAPRTTVSVNAKSRVALVGVPIQFEGYITRDGNLIEYTHLKWSFGDGATAEGWGMKNAMHTYYYPGEYSVLLDAPAYLATSDRVRVRVVAPEIVLRTGGDAVRSFVTIENRASDEIDLTGWRLVANGRSFTLPLMFLGAKRSVTIPSEISSLFTTEGAPVELYFSNGTRVLLLSEIASSSVRSAVSGVASTTTKDEVKEVAVEKSRATIPQKAVVLDAAERATPSSSEGDTLTLDELSFPGNKTNNEQKWLWYSGASFLAVAALFGIRFARGTPSVADEFEIVEEE